MFIKDNVEAHNTPKQAKAIKPEVTEGDIDESLNLVEETEEARLKLAEIPNIIGDYICQLCKGKFIDAFKLAQHRCPRIGHIEYRCPECDKMFNCPANLASHRRWHRPRGEKTTKSAAAILTYRKPTIQVTEKNFNSYTESEAYADVTEERPLNLSVRKGQPPDISTAEKSNPLSFTNKVCEISIDGNGIESAYQCETCGRKFSRHAYLRRHAISHTAFAAVPIVKEMCSHEESLTVGDELKCYDCDFWFPNKTLMEKHFRYAHQKEQFLCKFCQLTFHTSPALTRHINKCHPSRQECRVILLEELEKATSTTSSSMNCNHY